MNIQEHLMSIKDGAYNIKKLLPNGWHEFLPEVAIITGSAGPLELKNLIKISRVHPIPGNIPGPKIEGHSPQMMFGHIDDVRVIWIMGRAHMNEQELSDNYSDVTMVRVLASLGIKNYVISSMVGSLHTDRKPGQVCLVKDHISSFVPCPLRGNPKLIGNLSPSNNLHISGENLYSTDCRERLREMIGGENDKQRYPAVFDEDVVYTMIGGPQFETPSEGILHGNLGSNIQGMSVVREVSAIKHMIPDANIITMCMVSNMVFTGFGSQDGNGITTLNSSVSHENNLRAVREEDGRFAKLIHDYVANRLFEVR